jgi:hypothetical protein
MNAVVKLAPLSDMGLAIQEAVVFAGTGVQDLTTVEAARDLAVELEQFQVNALSAADQAGRLVIENNEQFATAGDLLKAITSQINSVEESRKKRTKQIDDWKKAFMGLFGSASTVLTNAKATVNLKLNDWGLAEQARLRAEQAAERKRQEDAALLLAQAQASMGDEKGADQILEQAAEVIHAAPAAKVTVRGNWGSTTSSKRVYDGEVTNNTEFLKWLLANQPDRLFSVIDYKKAGLNGLAKDFDGKEIPGFVNKSRDTFGAR